MLKAILKGYFKDCFNDGDDGGDGGDDSAGIQQAFSRHSAGGIHKQQHGRFRPRGLMDKAPPS